MNLIQASVQAVLPSNRKPAANGWISFNAVCCHHKGERQDKRKRGGVLFSADGFTYSCFNCGFKAGWQPGKSLSRNTRDLFKWLGMPDSDINKLTLETLREKDAALPAGTTALSFALQDMALPKNTKPIYNWIDSGSTDTDLAAVVEYIYNRGFTLDDYPWAWSSEDGLRDRVIIPYYYQGHVVGYTGRKITEGKPKYLNTSQNGYVFNLDAQSWDRKYVIVTEGQFDAVGVDGVAIMHNEPNEMQCARINALAREVIVVPDRDRPGAKMLKTALEQGWSMSLPPWGDDVKDVAEAVKRYGKVYVLAAILHYREANKIKIEIQKKKLESLNDK